MLKIVKTLFLACFFMAIFGCGGSDSTTQGHDQTKIACNAAGFKIAQGAECKDFNANSSFVVSVLAYGKTICSGVVIDESTVLTAAHCVLGFEPVLEIDTLATRVPISSSVIHPKFLSYTSQASYDVALIFTKSSMQTSKASLLTSRSLNIGEVAYIAGFGESSPGGGDHEIRVGNAIITAVNKELISIDFLEGLSHPCKGDSGGPLSVIVNGQSAIAGIVSSSDSHIKPQDMCKLGDITQYVNLSNPEILSFIRKRAHISSL